jgi:hypothetical protein
MDISEFSRLDNKNKYLRHPWETSRIKVLLKQLKSSGIKFPVDRIVDIGGGDAYVIHSLLAKDLSKEYIAIDTAYTPDVIEQLKINNDNSPVVYISDLNTYNQLYDNNATTLYLCMDVLEHVPNEGIILDLLRKDNNYCFFTVPAFQSVFSGHDVLLGHYRRYSLKQFNNVLLNHGFKIIEKGYFFTSLLFLRNVEKYLKKDANESIDNWNGGKLKTAIINGVLGLDFIVSSTLKKITGHTLPGLSCYCLCKK